MVQLTDDSTHIQQYCDLLHMNKDMLQNRFASKLLNLKTFESENRSNINIMNLNCIYFA